MDWPYCNLQVKSETITNALRVFLLQFHPQRLERFILDGFKLDGSHQVRQVIVFLLLTSLVEGES